MDSPIRIADERSRGCGEAGNCGHAKARLRIRRKNVDITQLDRSEVRSREGRAASWASKGTNYRETRSRELRTEPASGDGANQPDPPKSFRPGGNRGHAKYAIASEALVVQDLSGWRVSPSLRAAAGIAVTRTRRWVRLRRIDGPGPDAPRGNCGHARLPRPRSGMSGGRTRPCPGNGNCGHANPV